MIWIQEESFWSIFSSLHKVSCGSVVPKTARCISNYCSQAYEAELQVVTCSINLNDFYNLIADETPDEYTYEYIINVLYCSYPCQKYIFLKTVYLDCNVNHRQTIKIVSDIREEYELKLNNMSRFILDCCSYMKQAFDA